MQPSVSAVAKLRCVIVDAWLPRVVIHLPLLSCQDRELTTARCMSFDISNNAASANHIVSDAAWAHNVTFGFDCNSQVAMLYHRLQSASDFTAPRRRHVVIKQPCVTTQAKHMCAVFLHVFPVCSGALNQCLPESCEVLTVRLVAYRVVTLLENIDNVVPVAPAIPGRYIAEQVRIYVNKTPSAAAPHQI